MKSIRCSALIASLIVALSWAGSVSLAAEPGKELWLYYPVNLLVDKNIDTLEGIWTRAAAAGYTHVLLVDSKFCRLSEMDKRYFSNVARVNKIASGLHLKLVPGVFPIGYSNDLLSSDPNLAEGLPVRDTPFVVKDGEARVGPNAGVALKQPLFKDDTVTLDGNTATMRGDDVHARLVYRLKLSPFRCYHVSVKIKTDGFTAQPNITVLAGNAGLNYQNVAVKPTQDWTDYNIVFNSLDHSDINLYFGVWDRFKGTIRWRDWKVEEIGLVNVLRRAGTPCIVKGEGGNVLTEGKDYAPIADPRMGNVPYSGEYQSWHEPPAIRILNRAAIPDGSTLHVRWYYPPIIYDGQVSACIADEKLVSLLADQAKRMKQAWGMAASGYMMNHDEYRCCGWDESCDRRNQTPGRMLADNLLECTKLLQPSETYVWSDMFDPFHNAVPGPYYLVKGPWTGSWEGLGKQVVVVNWNFDKRDESLKFFADRGNRQLIAGYYDGSHPTKAWLDSAAKVQGVIGIMYTTWQNNYSNIEGFAKEAKAK